MGLRLFAAAGPDAHDFLKYTPRRTTDITHLALDITPSFADERIAGTATIRFKPIGAGVKEWVLDAAEMTIESVESTAKVAAHQNNDKTLTITFADALPEGREQTATIKYSTAPKKGLYFRGPKQGYEETETHLFTQGEDEDSRFWFPTHDFPDDKFTSEITCHVPDGMIALANGRKVSEKRGDNGLTAFHYIQDKPHVSYLLCLVAGKLKGLEDKHGDLPMAFYTTPKYAPYAKNSFRDTKDVMTFFEKEIGVKYPWARYDQVCVADYMFGGMENTTLTVLTENTLFPDETENIRDSGNLVAHELAHQWFGDLVTCEDWSHAWLNEGFATFYAALYEGHRDGGDEMLYSFYTSANNQITGQSAANDRRGIVTRRYDAPREVFGNGIYPKGAWVLRMLRHQLGEELYRKCIKTYLERHQFKSVDTHDLIEVIEELSGRSWDQFFDQWVFRPHFPRLDVTYSWDATAKLAKIDIKQSQPVTNSIGNFTTPLTLRFKVAGKNIDREVVIKDRSEDFQFALESAPTVVRVDPELNLLARVAFAPPKALLNAQLEDASDVIGRLLAVEALEKDKSDDAVARLRNALANDKFYGVRIAAANALRAIHNDKALEALLAGAEQKDARVRQRVMIAIGGFYDERAFAHMAKALETEKNPDIVEWAIDGLAAAPGDDISGKIAAKLNAKTFRNEVAARAMSALADRRDTSVFPALMTAAQNRWNELSTRARASAISALAALARDNDTNRVAARELFLSHLSSPRQRIRTAAISALGELRDERAIAPLEKFLTADGPDKLRAEAALTSIRSARPAANESQELRSEVTNLKKETQSLRDEMKKLREKMDAPAKPAAAPAKTTRKKQ